MKKASEKDGKFMDVCRQIKLNFFTQNLSEVSANLV